MKRRRFLQALGAIAASSSIPAWLQPLPSADAELWTAIEKLKRGARAVRVEDYYVVIMHPRQVEDLRHAEARRRWAEAWRRYRIARRAPDQVELGAREILEFYGDAPQWCTGTIEAIENMRVDQLTVNKILGL